MTLILEPRKVTVYPSKRNSQQDTKFHCFACGAPVRHLHGGRRDKGIKQLWEREPWQIFCNIHSWIGRMGFRLVEEC